MSSYLTWTEARALALAGTPVRREGWPDVGIELVPAWLEHRPGLWVLTDARHAVMRVVDEDWFGSAEFYAQDWTTDDLGTERDVCLLPPPRAAVIRFVPPGIGLTGVVDAGTLTLYADIGQMSPAGVCGLEFLVNGVVVGFCEAPVAGRYMVSVAVADIYQQSDLIGDFVVWYPGYSTGIAHVAAATMTNENGVTVAWRWSGVQEVVAEWSPVRLHAPVTFSGGEIRISWDNDTEWRRAVVAGPTPISAMLRVRTSLPLPAWDGVARWGDVVPAPVEMLSIDLGELFPNDYQNYPEGWLGDWVTCGPYSEDRWLYSHADNPAAADDDLGIDGVAVYSDGYASYLNGGATTLLRFLPAGQTFTVNIWNSGGWCYASGELRLYSHEL